MSWYTKNETSHSLLSSVSVREPEGVIAAAALRCLGGDLQGQLKPRNDDEVKRAKKMGINDIRFKVFPLSRLLVELEHGRIDMALLFAKNPERAAKFVYPQIPFCETRPSLAVRFSHSLQKINSIEDLVPLKIQVIAKAYRSVFIRDVRLNIKPFYGSEYTPRCYQKLIANHIDACYQPDHYPLHFEVKKGGYAQKIRVLSLPESAIGLYSVFSQQSAGTYLKQYEVALQEVQKKQSYEDVFDKFIAKNQSALRSD